MNLLILLLVIFEGLIAAGALWCCWYLSREVDHLTEARHARSRARGSAEPARPAVPPGWQCCVHCLSGSPCETPDSHQKPCSDGCNGPDPLPEDAAPVLGDQMPDDVREQWDVVGRFAKSARLSDAEIEELDARVDYWLAPPRRPVNGRNLGDLPRRQPGGSLNRAPWETGAFTVPADVALVPVYGVRPVADVLEAERLAQGLIA